MMCQKMMKVMIEMNTESGNGDGTKNNDNTKFTLSCYSSYIIVKIINRQREIGLINNKIQNMKFETSYDLLDKLAEACFGLLDDLFSCNDDFSKYKSYLKQLENLVLSDLANSVNKFSMLINNILQCMKKHKGYSKALYDVINNSYNMINSDILCYNTISLYNEQPNGNDTALLWLNKNSRQVDFLRKLVNNSSYNEKTENALENSELGKGLKNCISSADTSLEDHIEMCRHTIENCDPSFDDIKSMLFDNNFIQDGVMKNLKEVFKLGPAKRLQKKYKESFKVEDSSITSSYKSDKEDIKFKDLGFKLRNVIESWNSQLNKILSETESQKTNNLYGLNRFKLLKEFLDIVDDYILYRQNKFKDHRYFELGINNENLKGKSLKFKLEKKMWNVTKSNGEPHFDVRDIKQGDIGDCWLEATLKSMALKSPDKLLEIFPNYLKEISNKNGSLLNNRITVRLYDYNDTKDGYKPLEKNGKKQYYDMSVNTTELTAEGKSAWNEGKVLWPHMIERAIDKLIEKFHHRENKNYGEQIDGGNGAKASVILTGASSVINKVDNENFKNETDKDKKKTILEDILKNLKESLNKSHAPTCGTSNFKGDIVNGKVEESKKLDPLDEKDKRPRYIYSNHAYTLRNIIEDETDVSQTKVYLMNPWGVETENDIIGKNDLTVTLEEFATYFDHIYKN